MKGKVLPWGPVLVVAAVVAVGATDEPELGVVGAGLVAAGVVAAGVVAGGAAVGVGALVVVVFLVVPPPLDEPKGSLYC